MTRFWWVRHAPTHRKDLVGWSDVPADLSDQEALDRLSQNLPDAPVLSSDLLRCRQTAGAIIGKRTDMGSTADLRELHFGEWESRTPAELAETHPDLSERFWSDPGDVALPGGESWNAMSHRVHQRVNDLCAHHKDGDLIIVAHFGVILSQLQRATGMAATSVLSFRIDNLSVTRIDHLGGVDWAVAGVNQKL